MVKIDSHQHFWLYEPIRYAWIREDMRAIQRDFMPADLGPILAHSDITACMAVQADQSENETQFLIELADRYAFIRGIVGWVDLQSPDVEERLERFSQFERLKGFLHNVETEEDDGFLQRPAFLRGVGSLRRYGFTYDIQVKPHQLDATIEFVSKFPDQIFVINHMAKPYIEKGITEPWADQMKTLASFGNVYCKLSGVVTEADWVRWQPSDMTFYIQHMLETFGPKRLMFGSDWPICLLAASYEEVVNLLEKELATLSEDEQAWVWGRTAMECYGIQVIDLPQWYPNATHR